MPTSPDVQARLNKSMALIKAGRTQEAKKLLYHLLKDEPNNPQAWYLTSFVASTFDKKMKSVKRAIWLEPNFVEAIERRSELLRQSDVDVDVTPSTPLLFQQDIAASLEVDFPEGADAPSEAPSQPFPVVKFIVGMVVGTTLMVLIVILMGRAIPISSMVEPHPVEVTATPAQ